MYILFLSTPTLDKKFLPAPTQPTNSWHILNYWYSEYMQTVSIRDRGQITIPDNFRATYQWLKTGSVLVVSLQKNKVILTPYEDKKVSNWKEIWEKIEIARAIKGKGGNLAKFVAEDRYRHWTCHKKLLLTALLL